MLAGLVPILVTAVIGVVGWLLGLAGAPAEVRDKLPPALRDFIEWLVGLIFHAERDVGLDAHKRALTAAGTLEAQVGIEAANTALEDLAVDRARAIFADEALAHRVGITAEQRTAWQAVSDAELRGEIRHAVGKWNSARERGVKRLTDAGYNRQLAEVALRSPDAALARSSQIVVRRPDPIKLHADDAAVERLLSAWSNGARSKGAKR